MGWHGLLSPALLFPLLLLGGCKSSPPRDIEKVGKTSLLSDVLAVKLREACNNYNRAVTTTARDLARGIEDTTMRRRLILWDYGTIIATENAYSMKLKFQGIASLYLLALQRVQFLSSDDRDTFMGELEARALSVESSMADYLDDTLKELLPEDLYVQTRDGIRKFAAENPIDGMIRKFGDTSSARKQSKSFLSLSTLTEPLLITEGVKETAVSISEVAEAVDEISRTVQNIPTISALEMQLLLLDLHDDPTLGDLRRSVHTVSESTARFATLGEELPTRIREEVVRGLDEVESTRADLKDVVEKAATTATEARKAVEQVNATLAQAETTLAGIRDTTANLAAAGAAWDPVFENLRRLAAPHSYDPDYVPPPVEPGPDPDLENLARTAASVSEAGDRLHATVVELRGLIDSDGLPARIGEVDSTARSTVDHTTERLAALIDRITVRALALVGAILAAALLYRFLRRYVPVTARN